MADSTPPAPAGKGKGPLAGLSKKQKLAIGSAAGGLLLFVLVLARRGARKTNSGDAGADGGMVSTGQAINPAVFSDGGISAYNNLQAEIEALGGRIDQAVAGMQPPASTPATGGTTTPPPASKKWHFSTQYYGVKGKIYSLRDVAKRYASNPNDPNSVESELRQIVADNPFLRGRTSIPGTTHFNVRVPG